MPKFYEIQFYLFPGKAAFLYGVCSISGGILGNLTGKQSNELKTLAKPINCKFGIYLVDKGQIP